MSKSVKGTRTEQNLLKAFAGESQARTRYTFFASVAKKGGLRANRRCFHGNCGSGKRACEAFLQIPRRRGSGDYGQLSGRADRHYGRKPAGGSQRGERGVGRALSRLRQSSRRGGFPRNRQCVQADFQSRGGA